jgi:hypothetical protein
VAMVSAALVVLLLMVITTPPALASGVSLKAPVTVYYFHSAIRCETCLQIEELTAAILVAHFSEELCSGQVHWRPLNMDLPENRHFSVEFKLSANALVVARTESSGVTTWKSVDDAWNLVNKPNLFEHRLYDVVVGMMAVGIT